MKRRSVYLIYLKQTRTYARSLESHVQSTYSIACINKSNFNSSRWIAYGGRSKNVLDLAHVALNFDVDDDTLRGVSAKMGHDVEIEVRSIAETSSIQTAKVHVNDAELVGKSKIPHVVMAIESGDAFDADVLLQRIEAQGRGEDTNWTGILPEYVDEKGEAYMQDVVTIRPPIDLHEGRIFARKIKLKATLCMSDRWDGNKCDWPTAPTREEKKKDIEVEQNVSDVPTKPERSYPKGPYPIAPDEEICGFCRYMKEGPCGKVFARWEECILSCKENETDFVDKCAELTYDLKHCTDSEPGYYHLLQEIPTDDEDEAVPEKSGDGGGTKE